MPERVRDAIDLVREEGDAGQWLDLSGWRIHGLLLLLGLLVLAWAVRRLRRFLRARRPATLHPNLRKYAGAGGAAVTDGPDPALVAQRQAEAAKIIATSSTPRITGYVLLRQIEAVYVDGFRRPEEAMEGLKAVAAMKGANAVINVRTSRDAAGRYAAGGDAVLVRPSAEGPPPPLTAPPATAAPPGTLAPESVAPEMPVSPPRNSDWSSS